MTREEAELLLARARLPRLSEPVRRDQLETMMLEAWFGAPGWEALDAGVRAEFEHGALEHSPTDPSYEWVPTGERSS